jgi:hypothetical protein
MLTKRLKSPQTDEPITPDGLSAKELRRWRECVNSGRPIPVELQRWPDVCVSEGVNSRYPSRKDTPNRSQEEPRNSDSGQHLIYKRPSDPSPRRVLRDFGCYRSE